MAANQRRRGAGRRASTAVPERRAQAAHAHVRGTVAAKAARSESVGVGIWGRRGIARTGRLVRRSSRVGQYGEEISRAGLIHRIVQDGALSLHPETLPRASGESLPSHAFFLLTAREDFACTPVHYLSIYQSFISRLASCSKFEIRDEESRGEEIAVCDLRGGFSLSLSLSRPPARKKTPAGFRISGWLRNSIDRCDKKTHPSADRGSGWTSEFVDRQIDARMAMDRSERSHRETGSSRLLQNEIEEFGKLTYDARGMIVYVYVAL